MRGAGASARQQVENGSMSYGLGASTARRRAPGAAQFPSLRQRSLEVKILARDSSHCPIVTLATFFLLDWSRFDSQRGAVSVEANACPTRCLQSKGNLTKGPGRHVRGRSTGLPDLVLWNCPPGKNSLALSISEKKRNCSQAF